jgi:tRNA (guanine-N7-)-methyltransferase
MRLRNIPRAPQVLENSKYVINFPKLFKGKWQEIFENDNPIYIEIGMGKGHFIIENAIHYPNLNFIGIEKYSSVLLRAVEKAQELSKVSTNKSTNLNSDLNTLNIENNQKSFTGNNLRFICIDAKEITDIFGKGEISKIYLNFSDPWPKARHEHRRLTSSRHLNLYKDILISDDIIEFKTDNKNLFDYSVLQFKNSPDFQLDYISYDLHNDPEEMKSNIMTEYEKKFSKLDNKICKLRSKRI